MRLRADPRADRLFGRLPRFTVYSSVELLLLALIAVQAARLAWALVTPVGPVGHYKGPAGLAALPAGANALSDFDPFFRLAGNGPAVVTALNLKLHGVREDRATGRGSAIIALPDGNQRSFAVGEEIVPGVVLAAVGFDNVTISRNGSPEQIFLDQAEAAPAAAGQPAGVLPANSAAPPPVVTVPTAPPAPSSAPPVRLQPRSSGGRVSGITVAPGSGGEAAFRSAGFEPGDVIVAVNGRRIGSVEQARALVRQSSGQTILTVERDGRPVPVVLRTGL